MYHSRTWLSLFLNELGLGSDSWTLADVFSELVEREEANIGVSLRDALHPYGGMHIPTSYT